MDSGSGLGVEPDAPERRRSAGCFVIGGILALLFIIPNCLFTGHGCALDRYGSGTKYAGRKTQTVSNARSLAEALMIYIEDHDGRFSPSFRTNEDLRAMVEVVNSPYDQPLISKSLVNTLNPDGGEFVPNPHLEGMRLSDFGKGRIVLFYETGKWRGGWHDQDGKRVFAYIDTSDPSARPEARLTLGMPDLRPPQVAVEQSGGVSNRTGGSSDR